MRCAAFIKLSAINSLKLEIWTDALLFKRATASFVSEVYGWNWYTYQKNVEVANGIL